VTSGSTQIVGLIGWPIKHSLSPAMHNAAFAALGLDWHYVPLPVHPKGVIQAVVGIAALGLRGANVTVPHKQAVLSGIDVIHPEAQAMGAANTLVVDRHADGRALIKGYNTDVEGFLLALQDGGFELEQARRIIVVGAGGAARAVVFGLLWKSNAVIEIINRTPSRAEALVRSVAHNAEEVSRLRVTALTDAALVELAHRADLLVNATTVGLWPAVDRSIWPDDVTMPGRLTVFDLVYNPVKTRMMDQADQSGARAIGGLGMLVEQGALAFELWTGRRAPTQVMRAACEQALARR